MENLIPLAFAIGFLILWAFMSLLLANMGGWAKLAERFPAAHDESGETYYMQSGRVGSVNYNSCLILRACEHGLRMSVLLPFRIGHPPLFIPWNQFHSVSEERRLFFRFTNASIGTPVVANVALPIRVSARLRKEDDRKPIGEQDPGARISSQE